MLEQSFKHTDVNFYLKPHHFINTYIYKINAMNYEYNMRFPLNLTFNKRNLKNIPPVSTEARAR